MAELTAQASTHNGHDPEPNPFDTPEANAARQKRTRTGSNSAAKRAAQHYAIDQLPPGPPWAQLHFTLTQKNARRERKYPPELVFSGEQAISHGVTPDELDTLGELTADELAEYRRREAVEHAADQLRIREMARATVAADAAGNVELPAVVSLADLLNAEDDPVRFRIEGVWPSGGAKVLCAAPAGGGKTTLTANLVRSLADGDPFLDAFEIRQSAERIVVIDNEMTTPMLRRWLRGQEIRNITAVADVVNLRGQAGLFDMGNDRLREQWSARLRDLGADVVIFDCLKPVLEAMGLDENRETGKFLYPFSEMLTNAGVSDVLVHHHMGHQSERARGDSTLLGWTDANWKIVLDGAHPEQPRYFSTDKVRDAESTVPEGRLTFDRGRLTYAGGTRADTREADAVEDRIRQVLDVLADGQTEGTVEMNTTAIKNAVGGRKQTTDDALRIAAERGVITARYAGRARLYSIAAKAHDPMNA